MQVIPGGGGEGGEKGAKKNTYLGDMNEPLYHDALREKP